MSDKNWKVGNYEKWLTERETDGCPDCFGSGQVRYNSVLMPCVSCDGTGKRG
jgi:DnaJ-class molecular chaperone